MSDAAVYIRNANKSYDQYNKVLDDFSMTVSRGSIYGLLGASGCGKTTLLNAIVGRNKLNSGELWVLGGHPCTTASGVPGPKVGYMPQDTALCEEFTVKEAVYFFGRVAEMEDDDLQTRFEELKKLLELPPNGRYLEDCSGGQRRRVSFACALIQNPELLILDEPTAGVDPLLRYRIWKFLKEITQTNKTTVIITTHYIEETRTADMIGLMRGGKLLAEAPPDAIMHVFNVDSLEEVFLLLSEKQEMEKSDTSIINTNEKRSVTFRMEKMPASIESGDSLFPQMSLTKPPKFPDKVAKMSATEMNKSRLGALLDKNWKQFHRNISGMVFILLLLPIVCSALFMLVIGVDIKDIPFAIVNEESVCENFSWKAIIEPAENGSCHMEHLSCRFLKYLDNDPTFTKVPVKTLSEALDGVHHGNYVGVLHLSKNHSSGTENRIMLGRNADSEVLEQSKVKMYMDMSDYVIGFSMKKKVIDLYREYLDSIFSDCNYLTAVNKIINFEYIHGKSNSTLTQDMVPGYFLTLISYLSTMLTSQIIISERMGGIWDRSAVAGVTVTEIMFSHFVLQFCVMVVHSVEIYLLMFVLFGIPVYGSLWVVGLMVILQGVSGMLYGFLVSITSFDNYFTANIMVSGGFYPMVLICGIFWPMEAQPTFLKWISYCTPFGIPSESFRYVLKRGWGLMEWGVLKGLAVELTWILLLVITCIVLLKNKQ